MRRLRNPAYPSLEPTVPRQPSNHHIPSFGRKGFSGSPATPGVTAPTLWLRIDGGQELNAAPVVLGIQPGALPATLPADLDPGAVDNLGEETTGPTGTFPDGVGYGTLVTPGGGFQRVLVRWTGDRPTLSGWRYLAVSTVTVDDDDTPAGSKTLWVVLE